jgi:ribosomal-protein-alanine N-acetyltransferase
MAAAIAAYYQHNAAFFQPWSPTMDPTFFSVDYHAQKLRQEQVQHRNCRLLKLWISRATVPEPIIGHVALSNIVWGGFLSGFLGYALDQRYNGQGYMGEALTALIDHAFARLQLHRIEANIMPRNQASVRVVERLGFVCEGLSPRYLNINGVWEDHLHYVRLNE